MTKPTCPVCTSDDMVRKEQIREEILTPGLKFSFNDIYYSCNSCHEEGDFTGESDKNYLHAQKAAQAQLEKNGGVSEYQELRKLIK